MGFLDPILSGQSAAGLRAVVEILVLAYLLYHVLVVVRGTRAALVVAGVSFVALVYYLAAALGLTTLHGIIGLIAPYAIIALIVIFQVEIRRVLRQIALQFFPFGRPGTVSRYEYEDVIFAVGHLSQHKIGALIVLQRESALGTFIQSGVALDANHSSDLLISIFQRSSPLHDGAVIIQRGKIAAAACFLPLTTNPGLSSSLGTRHRAAIGITEESDCLAIVVSETNGQISIAVTGNIETGVSLDRLRSRLIQYLGLVVSPPRETAAEAALAEKADEVIASVGGSSSAGASERP